MRRDGDVIYGQPLSFRDPHIGTSQKYDIGIRCESFAKIMGKSILNEKYREKPRKVFVSRAGGMKSLSIWFLGVFVGLLCAQD